MNFIKKINKINLNIKSSPCYSTKTSNWINPSYLQYKSYTVNYIIDDKYLVFTNIWEEESAQFKGTKL